MNVPTIVFYKLKQSDINNDLIFRKVNLNKYIAIKYIEIKTSLINIIKPFLIVYF